MFPGILSITAGTSRRRAEGLNGYVYTLNGAGPRCRRPYPRCGPCVLLSARPVRAGGGGRDDGGALPRGRAHPRLSRRDRRDPWTAAGERDSRWALARATVESLLCGLADGLDALAAQGVE